MRVAGAAAAVLALLLSLGRTAAAYPQLQFATGNDTCGQCHVSPAGGGLIDDYGRDEAGATISRWQVGDGRLLHGAWTPPASLQLGGDLRLATLIKEREVSGVEVLAFPMQAELYVAPRLGPLTLYVAIGVRGAARNVERSLVQRLASREHYLLYEHASGWYLRAGRFFPIHGIRTQDHTAQVRRQLGSNTLEEPYGVAYGRFTARGELHVSAFTRAPSPLLGIAEDTGIAAYGERRDAEATAAWAVQTRLTVSDGDRRGWIGGVYKRWLESSRLMVLGQLDLGVQAFEAWHRSQLVGYLGITRVSLPGLMVGGAIQVYDPDIALGGDSRDAVEVSVQWFPIPHLELALLGRVEAVGLDLDHPQELAMLQLHYYL